MAHRFCFEASDRSLRDILSINEPANTKEPFGGMKILLGGDFRQVLPVINHGSATDAINASLISSPLWQYFTVFKLTINMQLQNPSLNNDEKQKIARFAKWILDIGEGRIPACDGNNDADERWIELPRELLLQPTYDNIEAITSVVYDELTRKYASVQYLAERVVICPLNHTVDEINDIMLKKVPGNSKIYFSYDSIVNSIKQPDDFPVLYPSEFLNSITLNNFPQHMLTLKIDVPVVLLHNIDQSIGLCNGTRLLIVRLGDHIIEAKIITGYHIGHQVCIPRIVVHGSSPKWPFTLARRQFPIKICYALTINKYQGQTLQKAGVYLKSPVFSHGQLYVAISRVRSQEGLIILIENDDGTAGTTTKNIVYRKILDHI
ncbi:uncharacterized protein LOC133911510 [Phragmites australis]|uniref:uncharacterized protein LOC133911510 n=1 Tax=Phragmites australis TaxID=29695 RepID=UPI002D768C2E|nr:uncharacterized protein LOC133911510 [Phragmites australis]XP_062209769.1 uncharacterized protein LOC133911510 [Phragmites australis]XP_062209778.1 uncharacterized protein LOC133911510 [Phragmites australis]XP_062209787.1 uncharacterized protein LOC133911510 [Phragmites australis]XP_062209794.1 uncharacterized protein LOC133911510 [Phragmites australis]XP_062209801.1 uncharacterized protein LOC133911510 [Phragmites australis]XP_062209808.1 uncharacterized protein LOC133911510 [Phragmites a